ncbi:MAG: putative toxin-antitoxin system toxin component, PIN family [Chloroflexota bacterium]|nr:putative toxin-antitoxin system toxin component, PIN family [Chloroflexota bacterium]
MKPRTVVDTNVFVSGMLYSRGNPFALLAAWKHGDFRLIISDQQLAEVHKIFRRPSLIVRYNFANEAIRNLIDLLSVAERVQPLPEVPIPVRDPKDVRILAAALGGRADYLGTGDKDLLVRRDDPRLGRLAIVTVAEFLRVLDPITEPARQD